MQILFASVHNAVVLLWWSTLIIITLSFQCLPYSELLMELDIKNVRELEVWNLCLFKFLQEMLVQYVTMHELDCCPLAGLDHRGDICWYYSREAGPAEPATRSWLHYRTRHPTWICGWNSHCSPRLVGCSTVLQMCYISWPREARLRIAKL